MHSAPPGFVDLMSDAENHVVVSSYQDLVVPEVGTVKARQPGPGSIAFLAMTVNSQISDADRTSYLVRFVTDHLGESEVERVYFDMMLSAMPSTAITRIARSVATWGTARPYVAVVTLAAMTGYHWRTIRQKLMAAGIGDPMALPSMHAILDFTEAMVIENYSQGRDAEQDISGFMRLLYGPSAESAELDTMGKAVVPAGFDNDEVEDSFDAFARAAR